MENRAEVEETGCENMEENPVKRKGLIDHTQKYVMVVQREWGECGRKWSSYILISHGIKLFKFLGPVSGLLLWDVCNTQQTSTSDAALQIKCELFSFCRPMICLCVDRKCVFSTPVTTPLQGCHRILGHGPDRSGGLIPLLLVFYYSNTN